MDQQGFYVHPPSADQFGRNNKVDSMDILPSNTNVLCRICLDDEGQLIQLPCCCIGQIGVLHQDCFRKWIQSLQNDPYNFRNRVNQICENPSTYQIDCEICKGNIKIIMEEKTHCIKLKQLSKGHSIASILCILFNIGLIVLTTVLCIQGIVKADQKNEKGFSIFISILIMLIVYLVLGWVIKKEAERFFVKQVDNLVIDGAFVIEKKDGEMKYFGIQQNEGQKADIIEQGRNSERSKSSRRRRKRNEKQKKGQSEQQQINLQL